MKYIAPYGVNDPNAPYYNLDAVIGRKGSIPPAAAFEDDQRELVHVIEKSAFTPSASDLEQLTKAIRSQRLNYAVDVGIPNEVTALFDPPLDAYTEGLPIRVRIANDNTGPAQCHFGPGWADIVRPDSAPLAPRDLIADAVADLVFRDKAFQLLFVGREAPAAPVSGGTGAFVTNVYGSGLQGMRGWDASGTYDWPVPPGITRCWARLWAGGGAAYDLDPEFFAGGDGGYSEALLELTPGDLMRIVVGYGVQATKATNWLPAGAVGGPSSFSIAGGATLLSCTGGYSATQAGGQGADGLGTGGAIGRATGGYGLGGGKHAWFNHAQMMVAGWNTANVNPLLGEPGACVLMFW